jgi:hypothetical protein
MAYILEEEEEEEDVYYYDDDDVSYNLAICACIIYDHKSPVYVNSSLISFCSKRLQIFD